MLDDPKMYNYVRDGTTVRPPFYSCLDEHISYLSTLTHFDENHKRDHYWCTFLMGLPRSDHDDGSNRAVLVAWHWPDTQFTNTKDTDHHSIIIIIIIITRPKSGWYSFNGGTSQASRCAQLKGEVIIDFDISLTIC